MSIAAVVLGASPTGLAVVRALGAHGVRCYVGDCDPRRHAFRSRYRFGEPILGETPAEVVAQAVRATRHESIAPVVIPTSDAMVLALSENSDQYLGKLTTYGAIGNGLAAQAVDKESFYDLCRAADVVTPKTAFPKSVNELQAAVADFQFPLLLKPIFGHLWRDRLDGAKLLVAHSAAELQQHIDRIGEDCQGLMIQELIPGEEANIYVAAVYRGGAGQRDFCFVAEKTRQHPPDFGSASLATAKYEPRIEELSWKFLEGVDYRGICGTEFKYDPRDGVYKMIEVNPRPTLWFHLAAASGVELLHAAFLDLQGESFPTAEPQKDGTRWCFWEKDFLTWRHHLRQGGTSVSSLLSTFSPKNHGAVGTFRDPWPLVASPLYYLNRLLQRRSVSATNSAPRATDS